jgi:hypothetical protein
MILKTQDQIEEEYYRTMLKTEPVILRQIAELVNDNFSPAEIAKATNKIQNKSNMLVLFAFYSANYMRRTGIRPL